MRLLSLRIEGFGVYDLPCALDFRALPENALFLIHGPTGGGKSMLLDAICFALFDESTTRERSGTGLRSDHAKPDRPTLVALEFALRGTAYRIERSPSYQRPAQRGGGLVNQPAKVEFHRLDHAQAGASPIELLGTRKKEVDQRIVELLGIDGEQFRQLVIIPQGRFREILTAGSREREQMMASLFQTERLARLQNFMKSRAATIQTEIRLKRERRDTVLDGLGIEAEHELPDALEAAAAELVERAKAVAIRLEADKKAQTALETARRHNQKLEQVRIAEAAWAKIEAGRKAHGQRQQRLREARDLQRLEPQFARLRDAETSQSRQRAEFDQLEARFRKNSEELGDAYEAGGRLVAEALGLKALIEQQRQKEIAAAQHAERSLLQALDHWRAGRAGHLASQLVAGAPCPVCGSLDHPRPATLDEETPDDAAIEAMEGSLEAARAKVLKRETSLEGYIEGLRSLEIELEGEASKPAAVAPAAKLQELRAHSRKVDELQRRLALLAQSKEAAAAQIETLAADVAARREALKAAVEALGFETIEEAASRRLGDEAVTQLEAQITAFSRAEIEARTKLETAREEAPEGEPVVLDPLVIAAEKAAQARDIAIRQEEAAVIRRQRLAEGKETLDQLKKEIAGLDARYAVEGRIAALANGEGGAERITFQRFVLAALLDEALDAASQRLRLMSRNRYVLRRARAAGDRRQLSGLDLEVDDAYTGRARPVGTLSGGESFLASLALALGMADVIARHAGGIRLETMFIDEGFGSLDPEALDLALKTLIDLRQEGRTIGIVSHVPELKERIDFRLEVTATARGSHAAFVLP